MVDRTRMRELVIAMVLALIAAYVDAVSGVRMSTTYETGAMVQLAETAADAGMPGLRPAPEARQVVRVLLPVVVLYSAGAAIGTRVTYWWGGALWIPPVVVLTVAAFAYTPLGRGG